MFGIRALTVLPQPILFVCRWQSTNCQVLPSTKLLTALFNNHKQLERLSLKKISLRMAHFLKQCPSFTYLSNGADFCFLTE